MIDALMAESVIVHPWGVSLVSGPVVFAVEASERDSDHIEKSQFPCPVYCRMEVADDQINLIGFATPERRDLYLMLRSVQGIGRRSALMILNCGEVRDTLRAVAGADQSYFSGIPGLGQKRIGAVLDKLGKGYQSLPNPLPVPVAVWVEARDSLIAEGRGDGERLLVEAISEQEDIPQDCEGLLALVQR